MKAKRRHELQANALAVQLETLPEKLKRHATTIMLVVTAFVVAFFLYRYRQNAAWARTVELANAVTNVQRGPLRVRQIELDVRRSEVLAQERATLVNQTNAAIDTILRDAEGENAPALRALALTAKGDLNWALANVALLQGVGSSGAKLPRSSDDYLKTAEEAYRDVTGAYQAQSIYWSSAQFGLAAIAENRHEWDAARQAYAAIVSEASVPEIYRDIAARRLQMLPDLQVPVLLRGYPSSAPATQTSTPAATAPALPATEPASTQPQP